MPTISLPQKITDLLSTSAPLQAATLTFVDAAGLVLYDNGTPFFPGYTDHGLKHVQLVLETACDRLIPEEVWPNPRLLKAADAAVLTCACVLHDLAMHIRDDGFASLVGPDTRFVPLAWFDKAHRGRSPDLPWPDKWERFRREARHFSTTRLEAILGPRHGGPPSVLFGDGDQHPSLWTNADRLMIGEFLRRHHARLAHEMAFFGFPSSGGEVIPVLADMIGDQADAVGATARSHNEDLRTMTDYCKSQQPGRKRPWGAVIVYLMGLLRIADYLQLEAPRAPKALMRLKSPATSVSIDEWNKHGSVARIDWELDDPRSIAVTLTGNHTLRTHLNMEALLAGLQHELDTTTAVLRETYLKKPLRALQLMYQRVESDLDRPELHDRLSFVPRAARLRSADDMFRLVVSDLYGNVPSVAARELIQNAVDAVRERRRHENRPAAADNGLPPSQEPDVVVTIKMLDDRMAVLEVTDSGIGMTDDTVISYFLNAGASLGTSPEALETATVAQAVSWMKTGRFGVGVLAGFLLGPAIDVQTRHPGAESGLRFTATLDSGLVELTKLRPSECPLGTKVSIGFSMDTVGRDAHDGFASAMLSFAQEVAAWHRMRDPTVAVTLVTSSGVRESIATAEDVPSPSAQLPAPWRAVRDASFEAILWSDADSDSLRLLEYTRDATTAGAVVHNGIRIGGGIARSGAARFTWSDPDLEAILSRPRIAVFDARHHMGLTLNRYGLQHPHLAFESELLNSIGEDLVAWCLTHPPERHPLGRREGMQPILGLSTWFPMLPALVGDYVGDYLCVLWKHDPRGADHGWRLDGDSFARVEPPDLWRDDTYRTVLELTDRHEFAPLSHMGDPQLDGMWAHAGMIEAACDDVGDRYGLTPLASAALCWGSAVDDQCRWTGASRLPWQLSAVDGPVPSDEGVAAWVCYHGRNASVDRARVANLQATLSAQGTPGDSGAVAATLFAGGGSPSKTADEVAKPWQRWVGAPLPKHPSQLERVAARIAASFPDVRSLLDGQLAL